MALTVSGSMNIVPNLTRKGLTTLGTQVTKSVSGTTPQKKVSFVSGNGSAAKELDLLFEDSVALAASTTKTYDLNALIDLEIAQAGVLTTQIYRKVRLVIINTDAGNQGSITFGPGSVNPFPFIFADNSDKITMQKGFYAAFTNEDNDLGIPSASAKNIDFVNLDGTNANTFSFILAGTTT